MPPLVEAAIEEPGWAALDLEPLAERAAKAALARLGLPSIGFSISLLGCDDARIAVLNGDFRGFGKPTNVLSWPGEERGADHPGGQPDLPQPGTPDDPEELGDIAIALQTCLREADQAGLSPHDHVSHLIVHGVLHLLGYDHQTDPDATLMESLEIEILAQMGIDSPYS